MTQDDTKLHLGYLMCRRIRLAKREGRTFDQEFPGSSAKKREEANAFAELYAPLREAWDLINVKPR